MQNYKVTIKVPCGLTELQYARLKKIVAERADGLKEEIGVEELPLDRDVDGIYFSWFTTDQIAYNGTKWLNLIGELYNDAKQEASF